MVVLPAALAVEVFGVLPRVPRALNVAMRVLVILATPPLLLLPLIRNTWSTGETLAWCGGSALAMLALIEGVGHLAKGTESRAPWLAMAIAAAAAGATIAASGSATLGQLGLTLAAGMLGAWLTGLFFPPFATIRSGLFIAVILLGGVIIMGVHFASLKPWHAVVLIASPLAAWVIHAPPLRRLRPWQLAIIAVLVTGAVAATAAVPAAITAQREAEATGY